MNEDQIEHTKMMMGEIPYCMMVIINKGINMDMTIEEAEEVYKTADLIPGIHRISFYAGYVRFQDYLNSYSIPEGIFFKMVISSSLEKILTMRSLLGLKTEQEGRQN